ncbi:MAG: OmpH family outer membrane protein [Gammaproteobacteria bacterium]|jgi:outer membrane protein|nr:OmpH family outer membrane protein [Gammaproteobacteria bacterium]MBT3722190.1 OmpH family outer membrane protein [Gammaproteobacteria bacterium]MBT4078000.1 OmpH family outer membrane protein [Gammaproteobacteria bacterium]MBT4193507.1 OmpH family outer membrane protein [Gammaproteobacteria bacterium]MBT4452168.1 OmpH family outer membrane protein [Gammaproteobacteria bacterium]
MKLSKSILILSFALLSFNAQAELKAAYINSAQILQQAPQAIKAVELMKKEFQSRENALRTLAKEAQTQEESLKKDSAIMSDEQKKRNEEEILMKKRKIRFDAQSLKEDVDLRRKQEVQKVRTSITAVINSYGKKHGYDLIFTEGVAFAADKVNITEDILKELKK